jgi:hypothetical protein
MKPPPPGESKWMTLGWYFWLCLIILVRTTLKFRAYAGARDCKIMVEENNIHWVIMQRHISSRRTRDLVQDALESAVPPNPATSRSGLDRN